DRRARGRARQPAQRDPRGRPRERTGASRRCAAAGALGRRRGDARRAHLGRRRARPRRRGGRQRLGAGAVSRPGRGALFALVATVAALLAAGCGGGSGTGTTSSSAPRTTGGATTQLHRHPARVDFTPRPGRIPPPLSPTNVYAAERPGLLAPAARHALPLVYVPNSKAATVDVI